MFVVLISTFVSSRRAKQKKERKKERRGRWRIMGILKFKNSPLTVSLAYILHLRKVWSVL